jgi:predicted flap endonuclease-1-like 5' DNA nuclease
MKGVVTMTKYKIEDVEGIGPAYGEKLRTIGMNDTDQLLTAGKTRKGRTELAQKTGISESLILKWVNMVDLYRINGIGSEFSELLEASGVDTVKELKQRIPANLVKTMTEMNAQKKLTRRVPTEKDVTDWIEQAKKLPAAVEY